MARVELLDPNDSDDPDVQAFAPKVTGENGRVGAHFAAETHFPDVMIKVYEARLALARQGDLGHRLFTKLAVAVSMANECTYCVGAYSTQLARQLGGDDAVEAFHQAVRDGSLDGREGDVIAFALTLLDDPHAPTDDDFERFRADYGFSDRTFVELIYIVNIVSGYNRLTVSFELDYDHEFPEAAAAAAAAPMSATSAGDD